MRSVTKMPQKDQKQESVCLRFGVTFTLGVHGFARDRGAQHSLKQNAL